MLTDFWQRAMTDVGIGGRDKGQGGPYLARPPDYYGVVPDGYHAVRSPTLEMRYPRDASYFDRPRSSTTSRRPRSTRTNAE